MSKIKLFAMDVDGTMTDGKIYMGNDGEVFKAFDIHDGYGIHELLPKYGIKTAIITGRESRIVSSRAKELEIDYVLQNIKDKAKAITDLQKQLDIRQSETAYMGDDIIDLSAMKCCGVNGCPSNAVTEVRNYCDYVSDLAGGDGAVRDFIEWLLNNSDAMEKKYES